MKTRSLAAIPAIAMLAIAPLAIAPAAHADETDISVVYSTQNNANAPISGSYVVQGRVDQPRTDMQLVFTILADDVTFPYPKLQYSGDFVAQGDATYSFEFGCDNTVPGENCSGPIPSGIIATMNSAVAGFSGESIANFETQIGSVILIYGASVPVGLTATVNVSVNSDTPGSADLSYFLQRGRTDGAERLSPTVSTPLVVTQPEIDGEYFSPFCVADLEPVVRDGERYVPTNFGRDSDPVNASVSDAGYLDDDETPVGTDPTALEFSYSESGSSSGVGPLSLAELNTQLLASPAGEYDVFASYTAPDGVAAETVGTPNPITVLGADDARCYALASSETEEGDPVIRDGLVDGAGERTLADTGADNSAPLLVGGGIALLVASATIAGFGMMRRRHTH